MEYILVGSSGGIKWLGARGVPYCAISAFTNRQLLRAEASDQHSNWLEQLKRTLCRKRAHTNLLLRPPGSNTKVFRYKLQQLLYAFLAVLVYVLLLQQDTLKQAQEIISWFPANDIPILQAGPLVIAAFVILVLANVPPIHRANFKSQKHAVRPCLNPGTTMT